MRVEPTGIEGLFLLEWEISEDARGRFARTFCRDSLARAGLMFQLVQANVSRNPTRHTLRGLHFQTRPHGETKIVSCVAGRIFDVAVDLREDSPTYLRWEAFELSAEGGRSLYIPEGLAHGFLTLEPESDIHYLTDAAYVPAADSGVRWDDPVLGIAWPAPPALISKRDLGLPPLSNLSARRRPDEAEIGPGGAG
jgi:dTDP-4-dehydrorhamnose 3,5-epimerase